MTPDQRTAIFNCVEKRAPAWFGTADRETCRRVAELLFMKSAVDTPARRALDVACGIAMHAVKEMIEQSR